MNTYCPFRKNMVINNSEYVETFAECNKEECPFCFAKREYPQQESYAYKTVYVYVTYYCNHPNRMKIDQIYQNCFMYSGAELGTESFNKNGDILD